MANGITLDHEELTLERAHKRKSTKITIAFHALLIILAFLYTCKHEKAADNQYAVAINFEEIIPPEPEKLEDFTESSNSHKASADEGAKSKDADKPEPIEQIEQTPLETKQPEVKLPKPTPTPPTPTDPVISETTVEEETDVTAVEESMEIEEVELEPVPDPAPAPDPIPDPEPAPPKTKPSIKDRLGDILKDVVKTGGSNSSDNPDGKPSRSGGTNGTGSGEKGDGPGASKGDDGAEGKGTGGPGNGKYDGSGRGVFGRKVIHRNFKDILAVKFENQEGKKIVAKICINTSGHVTYAELLEFETTAIIPAGKEKQVLKGFYGYKYEKDRSAPQEQCGKLTFIIENINAFGQ